MWKKIKEIIKIRNKEKAVFKYAKDYLESGFYCFENHSIKPFCGNWVRHLITSNIHFVYHSNSQKGKNQVKRAKNLEYTIGSDKYVIILSDIVVGFYKSDYLFQRAKNSFQLSNDLPYPTVRIDGFNDEKKSIIMQKAIGNKYGDRLHDSIVINKLFEYACMSPIRVDQNGKGLYLQHRDAWRQNIVWLDDKDFVFIDLDTIGYGPLFFDIIYYCSMTREMTLNEISSIIVNKKEYIKRIYKRFDIKVDNNFLDEIFYRYALVFVNQGKYLNNLDFLLHGNTIKYEKTNRLLSNMNN